MLGLCCIRGQTTELLAAPSQLTATCVLCSTPLQGCADLTIDHSSRNIAMWGSIA